ncbi:MAG: hypothetical protein ACE5GN_02570 [Waddliaceae bacterium]
MRAIIRVFFAVVLLVVDVKGFCATENNHHRIKDLYPYHWNELLFYRNCSEVWGSTEHDFIVKVKKIYAEDTDADIKKEYEVQLSLYNFLQAYDADPSLRQRVTLLEPRNFQVTEDRQRYYFLMDRLYPISEGKFKPLKRVYLGCKNNNHNLTKPRPFTAQTPNHYLSYREVENIVTASPQFNEKRTNIEQFCYDLGTVLALIHLEAKKDGFNLEVSIVKPSKNSDSYKMLILDFDKLRDLETVFAAKDENKIVTAILSPMSQEYYFPFPTTKGFRHFREGYLSFAENLDKKNNCSFYVPIAKKLFQEYTTFWLRDKFARMAQVEKESDKFAPLSSLLKKKKEPPMHTISYRAKQLPHK